MLPAAVLVDLTAQIDRTTTELGRMSSRHYRPLPEACHLNAGVRTSGGCSAEGGEQDVGHQPNTCRASPKHTPKINRPQTVGDQPQQHITDVRPLVCN